MKKRLNFLFYFFSTLLFSQDYVPLLDDYNEWQVTNCYFGCLTDVYYTDGDTITDGHNYKILDGYHFISRTILLREDILEKKVFLNFIQATGNTEYLLYDFSLNIDELLIAYKINGTPVAIAKIIKIKIPLDGSDANA